MRSHNFCSLTAGETADIPEMYVVHVKPYKQVRPSSDISDSTYPRSKQAHIALFTNYYYKSHILSATNNVLPLRQTTYTAGDSYDGGISVLNHCLSWSKFVDTHLYHSRQWFNLH